LSNRKTKTAATQGPNVDWLTPQELQDELRIGERLCYRLLRTGAVPSVRVGKLYRVRRETVDAIREKAISA
jgi:excisionase family DNA binding protein